LSKLSALFRISADNLHIIDFQFPNGLPNKRQPMKNKN
jgi:hypothetical protein